MPDALLRIDGLSKAYGAIKACDGVSLDLREGEIHAVIGPNGAGKTTLIGQIAGELMPDAGTIHLEEQPITGLPVHARAARGIARTYQITSVLPRFSALDNVLLAVLAHEEHRFGVWRRLRGETALVARAQEALARVGLESIGAAPAATLAHGQQTPTRDRHGARRRSQGVCCSTNRPPAWRARKAVASSPCCRA